MRRRIALLLLLLAGAFAATAAQALEIKTRPLRPFAQNRIVITSEQAGKLTVLAESGTIEIKPVAQDLEISAGETVVPWAALTWGDEPLSHGTIRLRAVLKTEDGQEQTAEMETKVVNPATVAVSCLPASQSFYANGKTTLRIECSLSANGTCLLEIASKEAPEKALWRAKASGSGKEPAVFKWDGKTGKRKLCPPGEYIFTAYSYAHPEWKKTADITLLSKPLPDLEVQVTGPLIPENLEDEEAVWQALMAPTVVGDGGEGKGLILYERTETGYERIGAVNCRTVGLRVLEVEDKYVKVGAWRRPDNAYVEGYVKKEKLRVIRPNTLYGAVVHKAEPQHMDIYGNGRKIATLPVSTGLMKDGKEAETRSGVYLIGTRMGPFNEGRYSYNYALRIDGGNLIHQIGYHRTGDERDFTDHIGDLGVKASHGCVRVDARDYDGYNAWWIWTHMGKDSKIIITDE